MVNLDGFGNLIRSFACTIFVVIHVLFPTLVVRNGLKEFGARAQDEVARSCVIQEPSSSFANP